MLIISTFQVVLTGEGSDEHFGGYAHCLLDFLRAADPSISELGLDVPTDAERNAALKAFEENPTPQDHVSLSNMSFADSVRGRGMLGGISAHRIWATMNFEPGVYVPAALEEFGTPDGATTIAEGLDLRARDNSSTGKWHPLNASLVCTNIPLIDSVPSLTSAFYSMPQGNRN